MDAEALFRRFRGGRVLLDTNLLLLLLIGSFDRERIVRFKRTASFSEFQFDQLVAFLRGFAGVITTPHILTEISTLANSLPEHLRRPWGDHLARAASPFIEVFEESNKLMQGEAFPRFGLTDAAIHSLSATTLILTDDFRLSGYLRAQQLPVLNFREISAMSSYPA
jgi:hypothetical protein